MNRWTWIAAGALALCLGCGDINVPDLDNLPYGALTTKPTRTLILNASTGLLIGTRSYVAQPNGYIAMLGILGREDYSFDRADPRFISEMLEAPELDPGSPAFGGNFWLQPYSNIRNANTLITALDAIDTDPGSGVTAAEKAGIRGFSETIQALDFLSIAMTRYNARCPAPAGQTTATFDCSGPVDVNRPLSDPLAPVVNKDAVLAHISDLLDRAKDDLGTAVTGGDAFPFAMGSGFAGFDRPSTFLKVNRALQARVQVYRQNWGDAKTALDASFIDDTASFKLGAYHAYGNGSGDTPNGLNSPNLFAHPKLLADAEAGDTRIFGATSKIVAVDATTLRGISSNLGFTLYPTGDAKVPIIRNEELILLRAEIATEQPTPDLPAALVDVNKIRSHYGLPDKLIADLSTQGAMIDEILKQRRYSLVFEGGHRWIDLRRYGKLNDPALLDLPTHFVHDSYPIPAAEMDARATP